jgi:hypothetical protein
LPPLRPLDNFQSAAVNTPVEPGARAHHVQPAKLPRARAPVDHNSSLKGHLYLPDGWSGRDLTQVVTIASDVALGLMYLHHYLPVWCHALRPHAQQRPTRRQHDGRRGRLLYRSAGEGRR